MIDVQRPLPPRGGRRPPVTLSKGKLALIAIGLVAMLAAAVGVYGVVTLRSQAILDTRHPKPPSAVRAASDPVAISEGRRLTIVAGCLVCHGADLTGKTPGVSGSPVAPNLTLETSRLSDADLDRAIRRGLRPDGRSELAMPAFAYAALTDQEVSTIIGYLRSLHPRGQVSTPPEPSFLLRTNLAAGFISTADEKVGAARRPLDAGARFEPGRHLASFACAQCHGGDLSGGQGLPGPDLTVRGYYDRAQFHTLMRTGEGTGAKDMELMSRVATLGLSHFSDAEIDAIFDYLEARDRILAAPKSGGPQ